MTFKSKKKEKLNYIRYKSDSDPDPIFLEGLLLGPVMATQCSSKYSIDCFIDYMTITNSYFYIFWQNYDRIWGKTTYRYKKLYVQSLSISNVCVRLNVIKGKMYRGGEESPCDAQLSKKCPCLHKNNTALIKQTSLLEYFLYMTNT